MYIYMAFVQRAELDQTRLTRNGAKLPFTNQELDVWGTLPARFKPL